jgi:hypothetical protein
MRFRHLPFDRLGGVEQRQAGMGVGVVADGMAQGLQLAQDLRGFTDGPTDDKKRRPDSLLVEEVPDGEGMRSRPVVKGER